jgi:hypothetical protein
MRSETHHSFHTTHNIRRVHLESTARWYGTLVGTWRFYR